MGFYSIYKIIKDVIKTLFGNKFFKIFLITCIIFTFIFIYNERVYASNDFSITYTMNGKTKTLTVAPELLSYKYVFLYAACSNSSNQGEVRFIATNKAPTSSYYLSSSNSYVIRFDFDKGEERYIFGGSGNLSNYADNTVIRKNNSTLYTHAAPDIITIAVRNTTYNYGYSVNHSYMSTFNVVINNQAIFDTNYSTFINPSLSNTQSELENLSFNNFIINANSFTETMINNPDEPLVMLFYNRSLSNSNNTDGLYPIKEKYFYKESIYFDSTNSSDDNYIFNFPIFKSGVFFNIGSTYEIKLAKRVYIPEYNTYGYDYFDNSYTFTISSSVTQDYINQLNQQTATSTDEDNQNVLENSINNQTQAIENQTQSIDNINNSITNSTVDSSSIDLPTDNTNDPTQSGVDNIFQTIYNSFTSGNAQDVVFPIPFTNKNITLQPDYISNALQNNGASWVITIIQAFYWYIISRFIIIDIMRKIRKIKQGNFENLQNSNIKEDML